MKNYLLRSTNLLEFITRLTADGVVYYPMLDGNRTHLVKFDADKDFMPNFTKIRTAENVKHFLFPSREVVARFPEDSAIGSSRQYIFGMKNCDLRGIDVYDRVFLKWPPVDPFYKERRENTILISADCPDPEDSCFCNLVGLKPYVEAWADINFTAISSGLLFEGFSEKGHEILTRMASILDEPGPAELEERTEIRKRALKKLEEINKKSFATDLAGRTGKADHEFIHSARDECVECFGCLHVCPTCYCFLLSDYKRGKVMERVRTWDTCYYAAYARVGGGVNPRSKLDERFWNRFQCKFNYFFQYEKFVACSGCGRCLLGCSAKIDIREILWKL